MVYEAEPYNSARKSVFEFSDQVWLNLDCSATETGKIIYILYMLQLYFPDCEYKGAWYRFLGIIIRVSSSLDPD